MCILVNLIKILADIVATKISELRSTGDCQSAKITSGSQRLILMVTNYFFQVPGVLAHLIFFAHFLSTQTNFTLPCLLNKSRIFHS